MFIPFNNRDLTFEIVQLDTELDVDQGLAACSRKEVAMEDITGDKNYYINYIPKCASP